MKFALHRTRAELAIIVQRLRRSRKAVAAFLAPLGVAIVADVLGYDVPLSYMETLIVSVINSGAVYRVSNAPKV